MKYSQKWSLVCFSNQVQIGTEFDWKNWPQHVSIASVFAVEWSDELLQSLKQIVENCSVFATTVVDEAYWGKNGEYHCSLLEKSPEILRLHNNIHTLLVTYGATFNEPDHHGIGFVPHSTKQQNIKPAVGDHLQLTSLSIIDMFPHKDHLKRRVTHTFNFGQRNH